MTTAYTSLLGLALPVTGELSGTWGNTVNTEITSLLDSAIAGTTTISADADITLTTTTGAANEAREAIILWTAGGTTTRNITAPAQSKTYIVINKSSSTQSIVLRGAGPTTGVTIIKGESAVCAWDGSDFIKVSNISGAGVFTSITNSGLTSGRVVFSTTGGLETDSANLTFNGTILTAAGLSGPLNGTVGATTPTTGAFTTLSATGVATFSAGTAALPAITTTGDTNTGIFFPAADTIAFSDGGAESMRIDSSGNVGIGTASPDSKLVIQGGSGTYAQIKDGTVTTFVQARSADLAGVVGTLSNHALAFWTNSAERARIDTSGNVGIGTSSPSEKLEVAGNAKITGSSLSIVPSTTTTSASVVATNTGGNFFFGIDNSTGASFGAGAYGRVLYSSAAYPMAFFTNGTERMRLDSSGNLGIGTSSPISQLDVRAVAGELGRFAISNTGAGYLLVGGGTSTTEGLRLTFDNSDGSSTINNYFNAPLKFSTNNTERMRIDSSGNLLVGTTSGSTHIIEKSNASSTVLSIINSSATSPSGAAFNFSAAAPNNGTQTFWAASDNAAYRGGFLSNGGLQNYQSNDSNLSDQREKKEIQLASNYLNKICQIPVKTFLFNDQTDRDLNLGVIAQDVQAVAPELVTESNWGTEENPKMRLSIYQTDLQYALMKALQELKAEFDAYKSTHP